MTLRFGRDQSLEYLGKKVMGLFGVAGLSRGTLEEKCLVIFSFRQAPLALVKFHDGFLCSFETNITLFGLPEVGNCIPDTGQDVLLMVRSKMRGNLQRG